jgi:pimeloyl-ACP methyl ester carboxylesterase
VTDVAERQIATNGIELNVLEAGEGFPLVLCHGFPELSYSWRHQIPALAEAGYRVLAPDMRGYGRSTSPPSISDFDMDHLTGDILGLLDAIGEERAVIIGHDWGSMVVWSLALRAPERVAGVVGMSVPFVPRAPAPPTQLFRQMFNDLFFYMLYFQEPGVAEADLERDTATTMRRFLTALSSETPSSDLAEMFTANDGRGLVERLPEAKELPAWLTQAQLDHYIEEFTRSGFRGGLNWYRNIDRNWELAAPFAETTLEMPAGFIAGSTDPVIALTPPSVMDGWVKDLRVSTLIDGAGHWVQQEQPEETNNALLSFLGTLAIG